HRGWMQSEGHRRNMLNRYHDAVGIGIICDADGTMWATMNMGRFTGSSRPAYDNHVPADPIVHNNDGGTTCRDHNRSAKSAPAPAPTRAPTPSAAWPGEARVTSVHVDGESISVSWSPASGSVGAYEVRRDGKAVATVASGTRSATLDGLAPSHDYDLQVVAVDAAGARRDGPSVKEATTRPASAPPAGLTAARVAGADRVATAVAVSKAAFPKGAPAAVLARADDFADALAGTPVAAAAGGPILLTPRSGLAAATRDELTRLGVRTVYVLGGPGAVSDAVVNALPSAAQRVAGPNRYATAAAAADVLARLGGRPSEGAYIADGRRGWPDAVSVSALAGHERRPLLLTAGAALPEETAAALTRHAVGQATIVGGTGVVPPGVQAALERVVPHVDRIAGDSRYATAAAVRSRALAAGMNPDRTWVTTLRNWPDSLVVGAAAAASGAVTVAAAGAHPAREPSDAIAFLAGRGASLESLHIAGGRAAVWDGWVWETFHRLQEQRPSRPGKGLLPSLL
ncbi:MAG TPA: cell wall-binding repeat-containing protein, partial [Egibacteraceae bacterium]|nr:cell wall-binding repeat-containing protein [Egibacteraceae bacterium]